MTKQHVECYYFRMIRNFAFLVLISTLARSINVPLVVNTWNFNTAAQQAWNVLSVQSSGDLSVTALLEGCSACEREQCDGTVGFGGSPDENGETTLDAMIFDGNTMDMGAVANLRRIKNAVSVARHVLLNTKHSILAGDLATDFAKMMLEREETLSTNHSTKMYDDWKKNNCQPNFWQNVHPDPTKNCGPYIYATNEITKDGGNSVFGDKNHDTIGMIVVNSNGHVVAGTSTNGATHKIPGRVGDGPIPGAGAYADDDVGAAVATGDGDIMMRFLPSFLSVELMRNGASPSKAAKMAIHRIARKYPDFFGAVVAVSKKGEIGAACNGMETFPYSLANPENTVAVVKYVRCTNGTVLHNPELK